MMKMIMIEMSEMFGCLESERGVGLPVGGITRKPPTISRDIHIGPISIYNIVIYQVIVGDIKKHNIHSRHEKQQLYMPSHQVGLPMGGSRIFERGGGHQVSQAKRGSRRGSNFRPKI